MRVVAYLSTVKLPAYPVNSNLVHSGLSLMYQEERSPVPPSAVFCYDGAVSSFLSVSFLGFSRSSGQLFFRERRGIIPARSEGYPPFRIKKARRRKADARVIKGSG